MANHAPAASAAHTLFIPSAAELVACRQFAQYLDADPSYGPLLTGSAARSRLPRAPRIRHPVRRAVAA